MGDVKHSRSLLGHMRLVTRGDLDGLTSAVIITMMEPIDDILLIHPQDITDHKIDVRPDDIMANVPYDPRAAMWFDHHLLTESNQKPPEQFKGSHGLAPSAARLVYDYYRERHPNDERLKRLSRLVDETDGSTRHSSPPPTSMIRRTTSSSATRSTAAPDSDRSSNTSRGSSSC